MQKIYGLVALVLFYVNNISAQPETFPYNGIQDNRAECYALTHAVIVTAPYQKIEDATIIIRKGWIERVGKNISIPADAQVLDMQGKWIYPSFIEPYSDYGLEPTKVNNNWWENEQMESNIKGAYGWNQAIHSDYDAAMEIKNNPSDAKAMRALGYGTVLSHRMDGIVRGSACMMMLGDEKENNLIIKDKAASVFSFSKGSSTQDYPSSLMGSMALLRQTFLDAIWYKNFGYKTQYNISLDKFNQLLSSPMIFDASEKQNILRANKMAEEFAKKFIIKGNGTEYQRLQEIYATRASLIIPLNFPMAYDVEGPLNADNISYEALKHWELAPFNCLFLSQKGIPFALTTTQLKSKSDFRKNLLKAVQAGWNPQEALLSLTLQPARMLGMQDEIGSIEAGKRANFIICSDDYFKEKTILYENWVNGKPYVVNNYKDSDLRGTYALTSPYNSFTLEVSGEKGKYKVTATQDTIKREVNFTQDADQIQFSFNSFSNEKNIERYFGWVEDFKWKGSYSNHYANNISWEAHQSQAYAAKADTTKTKYLSAPADLIYPFNAYGNSVLPEQKDILYKNATVWTNEAEGILTNTDVLVRNGKIARIGKDLSGTSDVIIIDCRGKHLTSGIIDEHSHIAIQDGVNEGTQASSSEVRIGDVIDADDVSIYRDLAGGVTACQLLHGSANPIGGQSALIKLRWGAAPDKMKIENADGFIKFALGENVKQSNWGEKHTSRFPQSRMGVEQVYMDYFNRAKIYQANLRRNPTETRRDLELDALAEILDSKRFITCHSYVQSEITMLMRVAEQYQFRINTFTHILEGFKVADKMKAHGVGASTFSDWWAYKMEVYDCTPYNAALLHKMNITTALNSDDAEMSRRLNQEAAKAVKYGNISEEDAWKMVTLNPAKLLHLDKQMGSIRVGKDADLVLWSHNPLSIYAVCEKTLVDGICYYDIKEDKQKRLFIQAERNRIIQKMLLAKANGEATQAVAYKPKTYWHCTEDQH